MVDEELGHYIHILSPASFLLNKLKIISNHRLVLDISPPWYHLYHCLYLFTCPFTKSFLKQEAVY